MRITNGDPIVRTVLVGVAAFGISMSLMSCGEVGSVTDTDNQRYEYCVSHGGSFSTNDTDFKCEMPDGEVIESDE